MTKASKMLALLLVVGFFVFAGTVSASTGSFVQPASGITYNENLSVNGVGYFQSLHVGSQGVGGVTYFNGTILNATTDVNGYDIPVTVGDSLRVDGELWAGWSKGDADGLSLKVADHLIPWLTGVNDLGSKSKEWKNLYSEMGNFSDVLTVNGVTGLTDADIPDLLTLSTATVTGDLLVKGTLDMGQDFDLNGNDIHSADNIATTTLNGGTPWESTNDGTGSTLDADMLDGKQGAWYMPVSTDNWVDTAGDTMTGDLTMGGNDILGLGNLQGDTATLSGLLGVNDLNVTLNVDTDTLATSGLATINSGSVSTTLGVTGLSTLTGGALFDNVLDMDGNNINNVGATMTGVSELTIASGGTGDLKLGTLGSANIFLNSETVTSFAFYPEAGITTRPGTTSDLQLSSATGDIDFQNNDLVAISDLQGITTTFSGLATLSGGAILEAKLDMNSNSILNISNMATTGLFSMQGTLRDGVDNILDVQSGIVPVINSTYDIGSTAFHWKHGYFDALTIYGNIVTNSLVDTVDVSEITDMKSAFLNTALSVNDGAVSNLTFDQFEVTSARTLVRIDGYCQTSYADDDMADEGWIVLYDATDVADVATCEIVSGSSSLACSGLSSALTVSNNYQVLVRVSDTTGAGTATPPKDCNVTLHLEQK